MDRAELIAYVRAQGDGSSDVVGDDMRLLNAPDVQKLCQTTTLGDEVNGNGLLGDGITVPGHVPQEHTMVEAEFAGKRQPHPR